MFANYTAIERQYHNPITSLLSQTNIKQNEYLKYGYHYSQLLFNNHPIVSDILYANSVSKNTKIRIGNDDVVGMYSDDSDTSFIEYFIPPLFMHEECHKYISHVFENDIAPYFPNKNNYNMQLAFNETIRQVLYNIASLTESIEWNHISTDTTYNIGQSLASSLDIYDSNYAILEILRVYGGYDEEDEPVEFIAAAVEIIANDQYVHNQAVQTILAPVEEYWNKYILPAGNHYLEANDLSTYCSSSAQLQFNFFFDQKCYVRDVVYLNMIKPTQFNTLQSLLDQEAKITPSAFQKMIEFSKEIPEFTLLAQQALDSNLIMQQYEDTMTLGYLDSKLVNTAIDNAQYTLAQSLINKGVPVLPSVLIKMEEFTQNN